MYYKNTVTNKLVEAVQLTWSNWNDICDFVKPHNFIKGVYLDDNNKPLEVTASERLGVLIKQNNGQEILAIQDEFILYVDGDYYTMNKEHFIKEHKIVGAAKLTEKVNFIIECKHKTDCNDDYSIGLRNGLELALSIIQDTEPVFAPLQPKGPIEEHNERLETTLQCILSCFSNEDLLQHLQDRKDMMPLKEKAEHFSDAMNDLETCNGLDIFFDEEVQKEDAQIKHDGKEIYLEQDNGPQQENKNKYFGE